MSVASRFISLKHASLGRIDIPKEMAIRLTDLEAQICTLLDDCTKHLKAEKGIETSCRIAGGWVRDKLLGQPEAHDIDIALSNMMGLSFAEYLAAFAENKGIKTGTITKIAQNPDQSKHLETATFRFLGFDIDLVNLRSEEYAENSRIPTEVAFGTPLQDALRRDTTINSLFYNIHTREVEDHTGKGLGDLRNGTIRTPLSPKETFQDDPLRILRCIRFASRFGFEMVPELTEAAKDPVIQEAVISKVARERIGDETSKMMKGRDPLGALQLIHNLSLYDAIFSVVSPEHSRTFSASPGPRETSLTAAYLLHRILHPSQSSSIPPLHATLLSVAGTDPSCEARLYLAAALTPYKGISYYDRKKKPQSAIDLVIRESLKLGTQHHYLDGVPSLFAAANILHNPALERFQTPSTRVALGLLLREKTVHNPNTGSHWTTSVLFSLVQELIPLYNIATDKLEVDAAAAVIELYNALVKKIEDLELPETIEAKPVLDGREVVKILDKCKPGAWTGKVMARILEWQLENPKESKEACITWLQEEWHRGNLPIEDESSEPACKKARRN